eukprot:gene12703-biopygen901
MPCATGRAVCLNRACRAPFFFHGNTSPCPQLAPYRIQVRSVVGGCGGDCSSLRGALSELGVDRAVWDAVDVADDTNQPVEY